MSVLLQISDTHFGTEQPPVVEALVRLAHALQPELIVLSGDITQRAHRREFAAARAFTGRLGAPVLAIPGNHDIPLFNLVARALRPYARHRQAFGDDLEPHYLSPGLMVLGVNTTRARRHENGEVSTAQIERVAAQLAGATPQQLRVVVVHQPVAVTQAKDETNLLLGHEAALQRWGEAGADILMGGHIHLPYALRLPHAGRSLWAVQAGTAVSTRVRDGVPNSVNLLRWASAGAAPHGMCRLERWDHDASRGDFALHTVTEMTLEH